MVIGDGVDGGESVGDGCVPVGVTEGVRLGSVITVGVGAGVVIPQAAN